MSAARRIPVTESEAYEAGEQSAVDARWIVAEQVASAVRESRRTGSEEVLGRRVSELLSARGAGDRTAYRAAAVELSEAAALLAVRVDLGQPI